MGKEWGPDGGLNDFSLDIKIATPRHRYKIINLSVETLRKYKTLKEEIKKDLLEMNIPEKNQIDYHLHLVGGEIAEFEFE